MRVNSVLKGFFNNRIVVSSVPIAIGIALFFIASSFTKRSDREIRAKQVNLIIRQIGHRLLLQAGDSTSRVLPVTEVNEGTFLLKFENEFAFSHDSLMALSQGLLSKTQFPSGYTVTVDDCMKTVIVYGFQVSNTSPGILACRGRSEPRGCYTIEFAFPDLYRNLEDESVELTKDEIVEAWKDENVEQKKHETAEQMKADIDQMIVELKSVKADDLQKPAPKPEESKPTIFEFPLNNLVYGGMMVLLLGVTFLVGRFGKNVTPARVQNQNRAVIKESVPEMPTLGKFSFDVKDQRLIPIPIDIGIGMGSEVISLTDKECKILELLNKNFGELIPRETLMQEVWINEGVITGRSLDMFVSKLRKKLSGDPDLRITNVHGKGYKLEMTEVKIS